MILRAVFGAAVLATCPALAAAPAPLPPVPWMELDKPHALCERRIVLNIAPDYFFEIANDVPGQADYNALISLYHKRYWGEMDRALAIFEKTYERSPLREAVSFLDAQSEFDRIEGDDDEQARIAEKEMRKSLLLYPKSKLAPVICATSANYLLQHGYFERALSLYRSSLLTYEDPALTCVFKMGVAETSYQLHDWAATESTLNDILKTCHNFPMRAAAQARLSEAGLEQQKPGAAAALEKQLETDGGYLERFHPSVFYNLGELKYRAGGYDEAKFYFQQFLRNEHKDNPCVPGAMKRMADIAARSKDTVANVAGKYLEVNELAKSTDIGRFAYAHALLLTLDDVKRPELNRRITLVDEAEKDIQDPDLKARLFLEKALASLAWGEPGALNYLAHFRKQKAAMLEGAVGAFIRSRVKNLTELSFQNPVEGEEPLDALEMRYHDWLAGSVDEKWARGYYANVMVNRAEVALAKGDRAAAFTALERWRHSDLWDKNGPALSLRQRLATSILRELIPTEDEHQKPREAALFFVERAATLQAYWPDSMTVIPALTAYVAGDAKPLQPYLSGEKKFPKLGAEPLDDFAALLFAQALRKEKKAALAEKTLVGIQEPSLQNAALGELIALGRDTAKFDKAYAAAVKRFGLLEPTQRPGALVEMAQLVRDGKLWSKAADMQRLAEKNGISGKDLATFQYLAGRAAFERANCGDAVKAYQRGIELDPIAPEIPEARFRLGKCLVKAKQIVAAKDEYDKLVKMQDSFWSPLARNELKLLSK